MKKCTKCGELKPFSEFYKSKNNKDGLQYTCKECTKEYIENNKKHRQIYYKNNKEKYEVRQKDWRKNVNNYKRYLISSSLSKHRKSGFDTIVTIDECMEIDNDYCFYCGCKLEWEYGTGYSVQSPTIDRLNNENTLTKNNIVFACYACNSGKNSGTIEEYIERCKRVVANENNILRK